MKKLIALFATTALASTGAMASVALSGSASVSYDDNGWCSAGTTTYDADLSIVVLVVARLLLSVWMLMELAQQLQV